jgi:diacylglycerol kinase family enzyme
MFDALVKPCENRYMDLKFFSEALRQIVSHSLVAPGRSLHVTVIVNPTAGGFTIRKKWKAHVKILNAYGEKELPEREIAAYTMHITEGSGSAGQITRSVIAEAEKDSRPFYLIITAGGDGTAMDAMLALYDVSAHIRSNMVILRLPMGTGNDGTCSAALDGALDLLVNQVKIEFTSAIQLVTASGGPASGKGPYLAFNILSAGLDAFVTHMTNKMKGKLPGDSYKMWVDIAALFYDTLYTVDFLDVRALDSQNREVLSFREKLLLLAMGVSGHRTYGSQKHILPDDRNVCAIKQTKLHRKLVIKNQVDKGTHAGIPETILCNAHRIEFSSAYPILAQMDGESVLLQPDDFPAVMELTAPVIPLLKRDALL